jgi:hypothetical protein
MVRVSPKFWDVPRQLAPAAFRGRVEQDALIGARVGAARHDPDRRRVMLM